MPASPTLVRIVRVHARDARRARRSSARRPRACAGAATARSGRSRAAIATSAIRAIGRTRSPVAGALFEYTTSEAKADEPGVDRLDGVPGADGRGRDGHGRAVPAGTYYRARADSSDRIHQLRAGQEPLLRPELERAERRASPYVAKVIVERGQITEAYPNRNPSGDTDDWNSTSGGEHGFAVRQRPRQRDVPGQLRDQHPDGARPVGLDRSVQGRPIATPPRRSSSALDGTPTQIGILSFSAGDNGVNSYQDGFGQRRVHALAAGPVASRGSATTLNEHDRQRLRQPERRHELGPGAAEGLAGQGLRQQRGDRPDDQRGRRRVHHRRQPDGAQHRRIAIRAPTST